MLRKVLLWTPYRGLPLSSPVELRRPEGSPAHVPRHRLQQLCSSRRRRKLDLSRCRPSIDSHSVCSSPRVNLSGRKSNGSSSRSISARVTSAAPSISPCMVEGKAWVVRRLVDRNPAQFLEPFPGLRIERVDRDERAVDDREPPGSAGVPGLAPDRRQQPQERRGYPQALLRDALGRLPPGPHQGRCAAPHRVAPMRPCAEPARASLEARQGRRRRSTAPPARSG